MPSSCVTSLRANREASSTITVRTPLPSIRSSREANPGRVSMGISTRTRDRKIRPPGRTLTAWRMLLSRPADASRCPCPPRRSPRWLLCGYVTATHFYATLTVVQKIALTAIIDQAHNSNQRPLLRGPAAKPPFGSGLTRSDPFTRRRSSARITSGRDDSCHTN
jgi:hypothetical protein